MLYVQAAVLCNKAASLSTPFTFLPLLWEKSALLLVLMGLMAGSQTKYW